MGGGGEVGGTLSSFLGATCIYLQWQRVQVPVLRNILQVFLLSCSSEGNFFLGALNKLAVVLSVTDDATRLARDASLALAASSVAANCSTVRLAHSLAG